MTYAYDDVDNLVTKVEPWVDDFTDGSLTDDGWSLTGATWSVSNGAAVTTPTGSNAEMRVNTTDADLETSFTYTLNDTSSTSYTLAVDGRYVDSSNRVYALFRSTKAELVQKSGGSTTILDTDTSATSVQGSPYKVRIVSDGTTVKVYRQPTGGGIETEILSGTTAITTIGTVKFTGAVNGNYTVDDVRILASNLSRSTTLGVNTANELTSLADYNGTTSYSYDELGRMISKTRGGSSASYAWHLDDRLMQVSSNFPGEGVVDYNYGGDGNRRTRTYNSATTTYNWNAGFTVLSEENGSGNLTRTYVGTTLAHIDGATPSSGTYTYYTRDHLSSTRGLYDGSKVLTASFEFGPYGDDYLILASNNATTRLYSGLDFDNVTKMHFAPFRYYSTQASRWVSQDPIGARDGLNVFDYVGGNPVHRTDRLGLYYETLWDAAMIIRDIACGNYGDALLDTAALALPIPAGSQKVLRRIKDVPSVGKIFNALKDMAKHFGDDIPFNLRPGKAGTGSVVAAGAGKKGWRFDSPGENHSDWHFDWNNGKQKGRSSARKGDPC